MACVLPLMLLAVWLGVRSWAHQQDLVHQQALELARAVSVAVDREIANTRDTLRVLAALEAFDTADLTRFRSLAMRTLPAQPGWRSVLVIEPSGRTVLDTARGPEALPVNAAWLGRTIETRDWTVSNLSEDPSFGGSHFVVAVPVLRRNTAQWVLAAVISSQAISDVLRRQEPPPGGVITLIDRRPVVVARTRGEADYVGRPPTQGFRDAAARMAEGHWRDRLLEGTPVYSSLSRSPLTGWTVGVGFPAEAVDGPVRRSLLLMFGIGLAVTLLALAGSAAIGRTLVGALTDASRAAHALAQGRPVSTEPSRLAEIAELAGGIGEAAAILETRRRQRDEAERLREQATAQRELALLAERAARAASEEHEARLSVTLHSIGDGVIATDAAGRITMCNPVAQALSGWTEAAALGRPVEEVFHIINEQSRAPVENPVSKVFREGRVVGLANHTLLLSPDGRETPIEDSAAPIRAADGALIGVVLVFRDATDTRAAEMRKAAILRQEQEARQEAEAVSRSKDEFVATVSHELRTPLNAIFGWVRLLRSGTLDEAQRSHALEVIERNTRSQAQLIEDLLDMSRVITGNLRIEMRRLELGPVVMQAVEGIRPTADAKGVALSLTDAAGDILVAGDPDRLQQVLWNLLVNAIKFTPRGGRVEVGVATDGPYVVVTVRDTGVGIPAHQLGVIFNRFQQGDTPDSRSHGGLGIGLALVRHLVELHGGTVTADSPGAGEGAVFTVRLPSIDARSALVPLGGALWGGDARAEDGAAPLSGIHALVVDDDADARELIAIVLRQAGAEVQAAASVQEARELVALRIPQVVVTDIAMPDGTGYELVRGLRSELATAHLPAVALTAYGRAEDRRLAEEAGFSAHLAKPTDLSVLIQTIVTLLGPAAGSPGPAPIA